MKFIKSLPFLFIIILLMNCSKKPTSPSNYYENIYGKWYLTDYKQDGESVNVNGFIEFDENKNFNGSFTYNEFSNSISVSYSGTFTVTKSILTTEITQSTDDNWVEPGTYKWEYITDNGILQLNQIDVEDEVLELTYNSENSENNDFGFIEGTVFSNLTNNVLDGVLIEILETTYTDISDENGYFSMDNIPVGIYTLKFSKNGYIEYLKENVQVLKNNTTFIEITLIGENSGSGSIYGFVGEASTELPMPQVQIFLENTEFITFTDSTGVYKLNNVPEGNYTITALKNGYETQSDNIAVTSNQEIQKNFLLFPQNSNSFYTVSGYVTNQYGQSIKNLLVQLENSYIQDLTDDNGFFQLNSITEGNYNITFTKIGFENHTENNVTVIDDNLTLNVVVKQVEGFGNLTCYVQNTFGLPISEALIEIVNTEFSAKTNTLGYCQIQNIPTAIYSVKISKSGYQTETVQNVDIIVGIPAQILYIILKN